MSLETLEIFDSHTAIVNVDRRVDCLTSEVCSRFGERLLRLTRRKLDRRLAARVEEQDVLQSVLRSFFGRHGQGHFAFDTWDDVWGLLVVMTTRKCVKQAQVHFADCRDVRRDMGLSNAAGGCIAEEPSSPTGATPVDVALLWEASDRLFEELTDREKDVLALALKGQTVEQIGAELGRTQRTVRRLLGSVRERLERMSAEVV